MRHVRRIVQCVTGIAVLFAILHFSSVARAQVGLTGGYNGILGEYVSGGWTFRLRSGATLTAGATYTTRLGLEPMAIFSMGRPLANGWHGSLAIATGSFGGDYRVDRFPELTVSRSGQVGAGPLSYGLDATVGYYAVRPNNLAAFRASFGGSLSASLPVTPAVGIDLTTGLRQNLYSTGSLHSAWWRSAQLRVTPARGLSLAVQYFLLDPSGSSPLLFDGMGREFKVTGTATLTLGQVTFQHSQTYDYLSLAISARVYSMNFPVGQGQSAGISYDDVPRTFLFSYSYSQEGFGSIGVGWEVPTQRLSFGFSR